MRRKCLVSCEFRSSAVDSHLNPESHRVVTTVASTDSAVSMSPVSVSTASGGPCTARWTITSTSMTSSSHVTWGIASARGFLAGSLTSASHPDRGHHRPGGGPDDRGRNSSRSSRQLEVPTPRPSRPPFRPVNAPTMSAGYTRTASTTLSVQVRPYVGWSLVPPRMPWCT